MTVRPIVLWPDPILKTPALPVRTIDENVQTLIEDMFDTMYAAAGIGLAAPQIGVGQTVIVGDLRPTDQPPQPWHMINPQILERTQDGTLHEEGCLSMPDIQAEIQRPGRVVVGYQTQTQERKTLEATGLLAICLQHEIDHLHGVMFIDHLTRLKRTMALRRYTKNLKDKSQKSQDAISI